MVKTAKELSDKFDSEYLDKSMDIIPRASQLAEQIVISLSKRMMDSGNKYTSYSMNVLCYDEYLINMTIKLLRELGYHVEHDDGTLIVRISRGFIKDYWLLLLIPLFTLICILIAIIL